MEGLRSPQPRVFEAIMLARVHHRRSLHSLHALVHYLYFECSMRFLIFHCFSAGSMVFHQLHPFSPVAIKFHHVSSFPNVPHILPCLSIRILQLSTVFLHYHICHNVSFFLHVHTFHTFLFSSFSARLVKSFSAQFLLIFHHVGITSVLFSSISISLHDLSS